MKQLAHRLDMMCPEIIHDHDIAWAESGDQNILQVSQEFISCRSPLKCCKSMSSIQVECFLVPGHTGWTDSLDFAFAHRDQVCNAWVRQKPHDPGAPYDAYDESGDTEEKARTVWLEQFLR